MLPGWISGNVVCLSDDEKAHRVKLFKSAIQDDQQTHSALLSGGREPSSDAFLCRWLVSRSWDSLSAIEGVSAHAEWIVKNSDIIPATASDVPRSLLDNNTEFFLQVRRHVL
jgi:hypothetical protein